MASAGPYASLHLGPDRYHTSSSPLSFLQAGCPSCRPTNSVKALKAVNNNNNNNNNLLIIPSGPKKVPNFRMALCNRVGEMNQQKSILCNEQTSSNMSMNFHLKRFHISRDASEIVLHVIKQCLQAVRHLCCWLYAGYTRTSQ